jgi:hypothetical protein
MAERCLGEDSGAFHPAVGGVAARSVGEGGMVERIPCAELASQGAGALY